MSTAPPELVAARGDWLWITGLSGNALGITADPRHLSNGGYHCGSLDLRSIDAIGRNDYSIRQPRDRAFYNWEIAHGSNRASATDIGSTWARGGRAAWLRFCALLRLQLGARDPLLTAVRGINYTNAAGVVRRFDCLTHTETSSSDRDHTHIEFWRDTVGAAERDLALSRITQILTAARDQAPLPQPVPVPAASGALLEETMQIVTVLNPPPGQTSINGKVLKDHSRGYLTPNGFWGLDDSNYGKFHGDRAYWDHSPEFTWAEIQGLCEAMNPAAVNPNA